MNIWMCLAMLGSFSACGVRGDPQPPLAPSELGRGKPTFKRSTAEFAFPEVPSPEPSATPKRGTFGD
jgi:hypothetical protein